MDDQNQNKKDNLVSNPFREGQPVSPEKGPELSPEVSQAGVEVPRKPDISQIEQYGVKHAPEISEVPTKPSTSVNLSYDRSDLRGDPGLSLTWISWLKKKLSERLKLFGAK